MKKLLAILSLFVATTAFAGTPVAPTDTLTQVEDIAQVILNARAASLAIYPSWDPYITVGGVKHPYGWGASLLYPVGEHAFAGMRIDFLGNTYWAPSAVVGAKYTLQHFPTTPTVFTIGGLLLPISGAGNQNTQAQAVTGLGVTCVLFHNADSSFALNVFVEGEKITNFDGINTHLGLAGGVKF